MEDKKLVHKNRLIDYKRLINLRRACHDKNLGNVGNKIEPCFKLLEVWTNQQYEPDEETLDLMTFNHLSLDFISCLIDSLDLLITGSLANAASIARIALEDIGILDYAITMNAFEDVSNRYVLGLKKPCFNKDKAQEALKLLDKRDKRSRMKKWSELSSYASHASHERMRNNFSIIDDEITPIIACRLYNQSPLPESFINLVRLICLYYVNVTVDFLKKAYPGKERPFEELRNIFQI